MSTLRQPVQPEAYGAAAGRGRLEGRKILVVGAGQQNYELTDPPVGNGRAMSRLLAREGARVAVADLNAAAVGETARQVHAEGSATAVTIVADVSKPSEIERMVAEAREELDGLDGLVANVGIVGGWGLDHTSAEDWDRVFQINVRAHYLTCKHALAVMPDGAAIVLTSSIAALMPANEVVAYHSSKAALDGLCMWLAKHAAPRNIRVNIVVPGLIDTSLGRLASKADPSREERPIPLGRQGTAWEVAYAALFLLSDEASYITGHSLPVDGGLVALR
jgi:NAD(P)-dependent dehydrogenase (short-subunit alcohol dehydrogenase family)